MTTEDLELAILELIRRIYCTDYCGYIEVKEIKDCLCNTCCVTYDFTQVIGYELILGLNVNDKPLRIAFNGTAESFLKFIAKELKDRRLHFTKYFTGYMTEPEKCEVQTKNNCCK